jgi:Zn-dependent metalloprotease
MRQVVLHAFTILCWSPILLLADQVALSSTLRAAEVPMSQPSQETAKQKARSQPTTKLAAPPSNNNVKSDARASATVLSFFKQDGNKQFGITDPQKEIRILPIESDPNFPDRLIARVQQLVGGVPLFGARATLVLKPGQNVVRTSGNLTPTREVADVKTVPTIHWLEAVERAANHYRQLFAIPSRCGLASTETGACQITTQLFVFDPARVGLKPGVPRLAWMVRLGTFVMFIDAHDGSLVFEYNDLQSVRDRMTYDLDGQKMEEHGVLVLDEDGPIGGVQIPHDATMAHGGAAEVYRLFKNLGREIDAPQKSNVRVALNDSRAKWHPEGMAYYRPQVPDAVDIVGHEFTHGVIRSIHVTPGHPGPPFIGDPGAISEGFADYFGTAIEGKDNWRIGESLTDGPLRDMANPHRGVFSTVPCAPSTPYDPGFYPNCKLWPSWNYGQPDHYTEKVTKVDLICDWSGEKDKDCPHLNCGIFNKATYLASVGGDHHGVHVKGIKSKKLTRILYRALLLWDPYSADMNTTAQVIAKSCTDLVGQYKITKANCIQVKKAFEAVGLPVP